MADWIKKGAYHLNEKLGFGGVPIGTAFANISREEALAILAKAWNGGIRYYDTSPWYGLTKSERLFGEFLRTKPREEYIISTKVGRLFSKVAEDQVPATMWQHPLPYDFEHDYTGDAVKRAIEDSLERMGLDQLDIVYVHDLSEDQVGDRYFDFFKQATNGAFRVLSDYRDQGVIKAWGLGVNQIDPILESLEVADPDICLSATQYSIIDHEDAVDRLLPAIRKAGVQLVSGAGYNSGFVTGRDRYNYKPVIPKGYTEKRDRIKEIAKKYGIDMVSAALHFVLSAEEFVSIVPGAGNPQQVDANIRALHTEVPPAFWEELKMNGLVYDKVQLPSTSQREASYV